MPDDDLTFTDLVRGEITFPAGSVPDFVVVRADGSPLYTFVNPVDDALMGITHVLRGEDLLSSVPRQIALYRALTAIGVASGTPTFAHLPYVTGEGKEEVFAPSRHVGKVGERGCPGRDADRRRARYSAICRGAED